MKTASLEGKAALQADVTQEADCRRLVDEAIAACGGLHILVNNAGRGMKYVSPPS